jgi:hypothetical protein
VPETYTVNGLVKALVGQRKFEVRSQKHGKLVALAIR